MRKWHVLLAFLLGLTLLLPLASCGDDDDDDNDVGDDDVVDDDVIDDDQTDDDVADDDVVDDDIVDDDTVDDDAADDDTSPPTLIPTNTIFQVQGTDSRYGDYEGIVEIREGEEPNFIRLIYFNDGMTFHDPRLDENVRVHTAWTGRIDPMTGEIDAELRVADFLDQYNHLERTEADGVPVPVMGQLAESEDDEFTFEYWTPEDGEHQFDITETWASPSDSMDDPQFADEDTFVASHEPMPDWLHGLVFLLMFNYHRLDFFDDYRDRPEFEEGVHYFSRFRGDFEFYRSHQSDIRVDDKWLDDISMAEAMLRRRAYRPTLEEKAALFDAEMPALFLNEPGFVSETLIGSSPLQQEPSYDGLLWNGCYLGSQVFRYLFTGEAEALENWLRILDAQFLAHDIPQDPTTFARTVRPHIADGAKGWAQGEPPYEMYDWRDPANNDMIQGLFYAYALSWIYLPDDPLYDAYRAGIAERSARLADSCSVALDGEFNEIKANWLAWMTTGEQAYRDRYQELWSNPLLRMWVTMGNGMFYLWGVSDWSGQHLDTIGMLALWFLADATGDDSIAVINQGWVNGMRMNAVTRQILWPIAAAALGNPPASLDEVVDEAIWGLREMPFPKQNLDVNHRIDPFWCASPIPSLFWKLDWMQGGRHQGIYSYPLFQRHVSTNYFVSNPLQYDGGESDWSNGGGPDYLHAYWLGRYFGVIEPDH